MDENIDKIRELEEENDDLKMRIFDLENEKFYSKENELKEFLNDLYNSIVEELDKKDSKYDYEEYEKLTKEDVLNNLKNYIQEFKKNNRL